ncbi:MAG TPA: glycosyltransferase family 39 protein [Phycisphaerae bacterium]|nr:glycosyltransferase family 39 protein [Phycisphaerae bacterium]HRW55930.1 glycosyltransferase family 39 protein [Phycisphaerae bacterium]
MANRGDRFVIPILIAVCIFFSVPMLGGWAVLTPDSFGYLEMARSIATDAGFPANRQTLPPGFAILFAPLMWMGDAPLFAIRFLLVAGWATAAILTFVYYRRTLGRRWAFVAGLIVATSPAFLTQTMTVLSELLFVPLVLGTLLAMRSWRDVAAPSAWRVFLCGALAAAAILVRTMGVVLIPIGIASLLARRGVHWRRRASMLAIFLVAPVVLQSAWSWRNAGYDRGYGYGDILTRPRHGESPGAGVIALQFERLLHFGPERLGTIQAAVIPNRIGWRLFQPPLSLWSRWIVGGGLLLICAVSAIRRREEGAIFVLLLFALLAIWPWNEGPRFALPMVPIMVGECLRSLIGVHRTREDQADNATRGRGRFVLATSIVAAVLLSQLAEDRLLIRASADRGAKEGGRIASMRSLGARISELDHDDAPLACVAPNESYAKTLVIGAAYFSKLTIDTYIDVHADDSVQWADLAAFDVLTVTSLGKSAPGRRVLLPAFDTDERQLILIRRSRGGPTSDAN